MLIIPMGTDAPVYHWPRATVGLIILNIFLFFAVPPQRSNDAIDEDGNEVVSASTRYEKYALTLGDGLHPVQWVTHNFLHNGYLHLIGNMIFLWAFGLVVEGKLGMFRFLAVYLLIGTMHGALTQTMFLWSNLGGMPAAGASAIIFGLLAICMVWAPHNDVHCTWVLFFGFRVFVNQFDLRYTWLALIYLGQQLLDLVIGGLTGRAVISELGHISGAFWGLIIGLAMLKLQWVDCEGWDIFSVWGKRKKLAKDWKLREERLDRQKKSERAPKNLVESPKNIENLSVEDRGAVAVKKVHKLIGMGDHASAIQAYDRAARTIPSWPEARDVLAMIKEMHAAGAQADSLPLMRDFCRKYPGESSRMRLKLAQVLIRDREKPTAALRVLAEIRDGSLPENLDKARKQLIAQATRMREDGVLELEGED